MWPSMDAHASPLHGSPKGLVHAPRFLLRQSSRFHFRSILTGYDRSVYVYVYVYVMSVRVALLPLHLHKSSST